MLDLCVLPRMISKVQWPTTVLLLLLLLLLMLWNLRSCKNCDRFAVALASDTGDNEGRNQVLGDEEEVHHLACPSIPPCHCFYHLQTQPSGYMLIEV